MLLQVYIQCTQIEWYKVYVVRQHLLLYNMASKSYPAPITCDSGCSFKHVLWAQHSALAVDDCSLCWCHYNIHLGPVLTATSVFNPTTVSTNHPNKWALLLLKVLNVYIINVIFQHIQIEIRRNNTVLEIHPHASKVTITKKLIQFSPELPI